MQQAAEVPEGMPFENGGQQQSSAKHQAEAQNEAETALNAAPPTVNWNVGRILNVIGVGFLVLGAVFLLTYSWQQLPNFIRIALGMLAAIGLIGGGEYITIHKDTSKWFGQGIVAGGYALGYFFLFAMLNVPSLQCINSSLLDIALMMGWTIGSFHHAMFRNSQFMAILSAALALICVTMSHYSLNSFGACSLLSVGMAYCVTKKRWLGLHVAACLGPYMSYLAFNYMQTTSLTAPPMPALYSLAFLSIIWIANAISTFVLAEKEDSTGTVGTMMVLNTIIYVVSGLAILHGGLHGLRFIFLNMVGGFYWRTAHLFRTRPVDLEAISKFNGLALLTSAVPLELVPNAVPAFLLSETALLVYTGLKFNQKIFRLFGALLSVYTWMWVIFGVFPNREIVNVWGLDVQWPAVIGTIAVIAYAFSTWCYRLPQFKAVQSNTEACIASIAYFLAMTAVAVALPFSMPTEPLATLAWPLTGMLLIAGGFTLGDKEYRATGLVFFAAAALKLLFFDLSCATTPQRSLALILAGVAFLCGSSAYAWLGQKMHPKAAPTP